MTKKKNKISNKRTVERTISAKKTSELYQEVDGTIMDARISIKMYMDKNNLSQHHDIIDDILFKCGIKASQRAIDLFNKK